MEEKKSVWKARVSWCILLAACLMLFVKWIVPSTLRSAVILFSKVPQSKDWVTTKGTIEWKAESKAGTPRSGSPSTPNVTYRCIYDYEVDGKTYAGREMRIGETAVPNDGITGFSKSELKARYEEADGAVTVYYNPENPAECALSREVDKERVFFFVLKPLVCVIVALLFGWTAYRHFKGAGSQSTAAEEGRADCPHCKNEFTISFAETDPLQQCPHCGEEVTLPFSLLNHSG